MRILYIIISMLISFSLFSQGNSFKVETAESEMKTRMKMFFKKYSQDINIIRTEEYSKWRKTGFSKKQFLVPAFHNQYLPVFLPKTEHEIYTNAAGLAIVDPDLDATQGGIALFLKNGLGTILNYRFLENESETENKSIVRENNFLTDLAIIVPLKKWEFSIKAENLFNRNWKKTEADPLSWFTMEKNIIQEFIFTPDTPSFFTASLTIKF